MEQALKAKVKIKTEIETERIDQEKMKPYRFIFLIPVIIIITASCQKKIIHKYQVEIERENWSTENKFQSHFEIDDTINTYSIFLNICAQFSALASPLLVNIGSLLPSFTFSACRIKNI